MKRRSWLLSAASSVAVVPLAGCAALSTLLRGVLEEPRVRIVGMRLRTLAITHLGMRFDVDIENPNRIGISLHRIDYTLMAFGEQVASGQTDGAVSLPARGEARTVVDIDFPFGESGRTILKLLRRETVPYQLDAVFHLGDDRLSIPVPARFAGEAPLPKPPKVGVKQLRVTGVETGGISLRLIALVDNPNAFDIPVQKLRVLVSLNERDVLKNVTIEHVVVRKSAVTEVPLDFTVGLTALGLSMASLLQRPKLDWKVELELYTDDVGLPFTAAGQLTW